jgi:hypothetical protein
LRRAILNEKVDFRISGKARITINLTGFSDGSSGSVDVSKFKNFFAVIGNGIGAVSISKLPQNSFKLVASVLAAEGLSRSCADFPLSRRSAETRADQCRHKRIAHTEIWVMIMKRPGYTTTVSG